MQKPEKANASFFVPKKIGGDAIDCVYKEVII